MQLLPYVEVNGSWTIPDNLMQGLYLKLEAQGIAKNVFTDGSIRSGYEFLEKMKNGNNLPVAAIDDNQVIGFGWLNTIAERRAFCHHFFYKEAWGKKTLSTAKEFINYWFDMKNGETYLFDYLIGMTPPENKIGIQFAKRLGFNIVGYVPTFGIISYLERKNYGKR